MSHQSAIREAVHSKRTLVFHSSHEVPQNLENPFAQCPGGYQLVAAVATENLEAAFHLTNHLEQAWQLNDGVIAYVDCCRSTSVGDVMVTPDGKAHLCLMTGWRELGDVVQFG